MQESSSPQDDDDSMAPHLQMIERLRELEKVAIASGIPEEHLIYIVENPRACVLFTEYKDKAEQRFQDWWDDGWISNHGDDYDEDGHYTGVDPGMSQLFVMDGRRPDLMLQAVPSLAIDDPGLWEQFVEAATENTTGEECN